MISIELEDCFKDEVKVINKSVTTLDQYDIRYLIWARRLIRA